MRRILSFVAATAFAMSAAAQAPPQAPPQSQPVELPEEQLLKTADEIAAMVGQIRGLPVKEPVKKGIKKRDELRAVLIQKLGEEVKDADIEAEAAVFKRLGVIPQDLDYKKMLLDLLTEQIAGFYDPKTAELYIMQGIPLAMQRPAMAHELFHAIQDQHFDIEAMQEPFKTTENSDFALARSALLEGDATVLMFDFSMYENKQLPQGSVTSLIDIPMANNMLRQINMDSIMSLDSLSGALGGGGNETMSAADTALAEAPRIFRESLVFPYFAGMRFIVMARTQRTWKDIDKIYENPPVSTEQIMHPEKYFEGDEPEHLQFDASAAFVGWKPIYDSVIGEFQLQQILKAHPAPGVNVNDAAMGWDGDRIHGFQDESGHTAVVFMSSWDSISEAQEFYRAAVAVAKTRYPNAVVTNNAKGHGQSTCLAMQGGSKERLYVEQWGDLVLYVEGTTSKLDGDGKELDPMTHRVRETAFKTLKREPFRDVMARELERKKAAAK